MPYALSKAIKYMVGMEGEALFQQWSRGKKVGGGIFPAQEEVHQDELWAEIGFIDSRISLLYRIGALALYLNERT